eukprot:XP_001703268.1 predicted protein [Chlamydomonas reinhardtii]
MPIAWSRHRAAPGSVAVTPAAMPPSVKMEVKPEPNALAAGLAGITDPASMAALANLAAAGASMPGLAGALGATPGAMPGGLPPMPGGGGVDGLGTGGETDDDDDERTKSGRRRRKDVGKQRQAGRAWTPEEETLFLKAMEAYGRDWKKGSELVGTRDHRAIASHAQKYLIKLCLAGKPLPAAIARTGAGYTLSGAMLDPYSAAARSYGFKPELLLRLTHEELSVIGLLGGTWHPETKQLVVIEAYPCRRAEGSDAATSVELDPTAQVEVQSLMEAKGQTCVGWYHSHPVFEPSPSQKDMDNQRNYQALFKTNVHGLEVVPDQPLVDKLTSMLDTFRDDPGRVDFGELWRNYSYADNSVDGLPLTRLAKFRHSLQSRMRDADPTAVRQVLDTLCAEVSGLYAQLAAAGVAGFQPPQEAGAEQLQPVDGGSETRYICHRYKYITGTPRPAYRRL